MLQRYIKPRENGNLSRFSEAHPIQDHVKDKERRKQSRKTACRDCRAISYLLQKQGKRQVKLNVLPPPCIAEFTSVFCACFERRLFELVRTVSYFLQRYANSDAPRIPIYWYIDCRSPQFIINTISGPGHPQFSTCCARTTS